MAEEQVPVMVTIPVYSKKIGILKTLKNGLIWYGIPAVLFLIQNQTQWVPDDYELPIGAFLGLIGYFIKNYYENKNPTNPNEQKTEAPSAPAQSSTSK